MLRIAFASHTPFDGTTYLLAGRHRLRLWVDETGAFVDASQIARVEFVDTYLGMYRLLPREEMVNPIYALEAHHTGPRATKWRGDFPPPVRTADEADEPGVWTYDYETWHDWGRVLEPTGIAYDAEGRELARATVGVCRNAHHGGFVTVDEFAGVKATEVGSAAVYARLREPVSGLFSFTTFLKRSDSLVTLLNEAGAGSDPTYAREAGLSLSLFVDEEWQDPFLYFSPNDPTRAGDSYYGNGIAIPAPGTLGESSFLGFRTVWWLDTRRFPNGRHRVRVVSETVAPGDPTVHRRPGNAYDSNSYGEKAEAKNCVMEFDLLCENGNTALAVVPSEDDIWLVPGESTTLTFELLRCDGTRTPLAPHHVRLRSEARQFVESGFLWRDSRTVATVNGLTITARPTIGPGGLAPFTAELRDGAGEYYYPVRSHRITVRVRSVVKKPHFTLDGPATAYVPGRSLFVVNMFQLGWNDFRDEAGELGTPTETAFAGALLAHGINCLNVGFIANAAPDVLLADWQANALKYLNGDFTNLATIRENPGLFRFSRRTGTLLYGAGDSIGRMRVELLNTVQNPWMLSTGIPWIMQLAVDSKRMPLMDVFDEVSLIFGSGPLPDENYSSNAIEAGPNPSFTVPPGSPALLDIPNDIVHQIADALRATTGGEVAIAFPILGQDHPYNAFVWYADPAKKPGTFCSVFFTTWQRQRPDDTAMWQLWKDIGRNLDEWMKGNEDPFVLQQPGASSFYNKLARGDHYRPGRDWSYVQSRVGTPPEAPAITVSLAVARGAGGLRLYIAESARTVLAERLTKTLPRLGEVQTGFGPDIQPRLWEAYGRILPVIHEYTDLVMMPNRSAPALDYRVFTGKLDGEAGKLVLVVNPNAFPVEVPTAKLALAEYVGGERIRFHSDDPPERTPWTLDLAGAPTATLGAFEAVWWLWRDPSFAHPPRPATLSLGPATLIPPGGTTNAVRARVLDENGLPVPGVTVFFEVVRNGYDVTEYATVDAEAVTDADGYATPTLTGLLAGPVYLVASADVAPPLAPVGLELEVAEDPETALFVSMLDGWEADTGVTVVDGKASALESLLVPGGHVLGSNLEGWRPTVVPNGLGGKPVLAFGGGHALWTPAYAHPATSLVTVLAKRTGGVFPVGLCNVDAGVRLFQFRFYPDGNTLEALSFDAGGNPVSDTQPIPEPDDDWHVYQMVRRANAVEAFVDGVSVGATAMPSSGAGVEQFIVGQASGFSAGFVGQIAAVLYHGNENRRAVARDYLVTKWLA